MSIKLNNISYVYNEHTVMETKALHNINLTINKGEFIGLIGHTGSGKSTLMQVLNGLIKPTSGTITFNDEDIHSKSYNKKFLRSKVGLVFQYPEYQLFEETVFKDVAFGPKNLNLSLEEINSRVVEALNLVNLGEEYYEKSPFLLSGGEKRRVAIAGVLAMRPDYLILDEPTAGLDPEGKNNILSGINILNKELGITIIMVSHSMEDVAQYTNRLIVMNSGKIIYDDDTKEVFKHIKELESMNLTVPYISKVMYKLNELGWNLDYTMNNIDDVTNEILRELQND